MVSIPRCPPGARGLLALLLLLPLPGACGRCGSPPSFSFAEGPRSERYESVWGGYPVKSSLKYSCRPGYILDPRKSPFLTCGEDLEWSGDPEFCVGRPCKAVELQNGRVDLTDLRFGAIANFSCDEGYRLIGPTFAQCVLAGNGVDWDKELPLCQGKSCGVPKGPEHGRAVDVTNDLYGAKVNIMCDEGFRLHGPTFIQCVLKGEQVEWSQLPACQEKQNTSDVCEVVPESRVFTECGVPLEKLKTLLEVRKLYLEIEKLKQELKSQ